MLIVDSNTGKVSEATSSAMTEPAMVVDAEGMDVDTEVQADKMAPSPQYLNGDGTVTCSIDLAGACMTKDNKLVQVIDLTEELVSLFYKNVYTN